MSMLENLEQGMCFYCASAHLVSGWKPGLPKPARRYRMCFGEHKQTSLRVTQCPCPCEKFIEYPPMVGYSNIGILKK